MKQITDGTFVHASRRKVKRRLFKENLDHKLDQIVRSRPQVLVAVQDQIKGLCGTQIAG